MNPRTFSIAVLALGAFSANASAAFHIMQIEELIGGISGNTNAQAIQLRTRSAGQSVLSASRLRAWDANGANPVLLLDMTTNVSNGASGARVLLASSGFNTLMAGVAGYESDFTLANTIPTSYLSGGKITFEDDGGTIYWALAFGAYTGSNTGNGQNDADSNFGAPFPSALPIAGRQGIQFNGPATAGSTTNFADYGLTLDPATVVNNDGNSFTVVPEPTSFAFIGLGALALGGIVLRRRRSA